MKEAVDKMLKHPIKTAIIINTSLIGTAYIIKATTSGVTRIIQEVRNLYLLHKKGGE